MEVRKFVFLKEKEEHCYTRELKTYKRHRTLYGKIVQITTGEGCDHDHQHLKD